MSEVHREELAEGRDHLTVTGTFQSDKYPWCPAGFVPLKMTDPGARDLLDEYAKRRGAIDPEFQRDLLEALNNVPAKPNAGYENFDTVQKLQGARSRRMETGKIEKLLVALLECQQYGLESSAERNSVCDIVRDVIRKLRRE